MKKFMSKIDDNILKCIHILLQIILITIIIYLARYKPELNKYIMVLIILSIGNAMNYYLLWQIEEKACLAGKFYKYNLNYLYCNKHIYP